MLDGVHDSGQLGQLGLDVELGPGVRARHELLGLHVVVVGPEDVVAVGAAGGVGGAGG